jgi:hypothetical protein
VRYGGAHQKLFLHLPLETRREDVQNCVAATRPCKHYAGALLPISLTGSTVQLLVRPPPAHLPPEMGMPPARPHCTAAARLHVPSPHPSRQAPLPDMDMASCIPTETAEGLTARSSGLCAKKQMRRRCGQRRRAAAPQCGRHEREHASSSSRSWSLSSSLSRLGAGRSTAAAARGAHGMPLLAG